jgi:hypothetical protein
VGLSLWCQRSTRHGKHTNSTSLGWNVLFQTSWGRFQRRFETIFEDLDRHGKLVDQQASALSIAEVAQIRRENSEWREKRLGQISNDEKLQADNEYRSIISWLKIDETEQTQIVEAISDEEKQFPGTCDWVSQNAKIKAWLQKRPECAYLRLQGSPGCGKSVIAAKLVSYLQAVGSPIVRHFCTDTFPSSTRYDSVLKSFILQLLVRSDELVAHVYKECNGGRKQITPNFLAKLLQTLIASLSDQPRDPLHIWFIVDGINECDEQVQLINLMNKISLISAASHGAVCKVLLTTRPMSRTIMAKFKKSPDISLSENNSPLNSAIRMYVARRLVLLQDRFRELELDPQRIDELGERISNKANSKNTSMLLSYRI